MVYINGLGQIRVGVRPWVDSGIDPSANLFFAASGLSDTTQRNAVNTLVKDLKRFGLWSKIKAFYPFVGGTAESHKWNLIDTGVYGLSFSGGWTHNSNGIKGNNSNTVANTNLSLRTVFGATSSEHTLGIYINENPTGMSYRSDIGAADGAFNFTAPYITPPIIGFFNTGSSLYLMDIASDNWYSYTLSPPSNVTGLTELKRYRSAYALSTYNGYEVTGRRTTTTTSFYNPVGNVTIGSIQATNWTSYSTNRYSTAYIASALTTIESNLMYVAIQRFNTSLNRHVGTGISTIIGTFSGTASLVTSGLKVNLDASNLPVPSEGALTSNLPGQYFSSTSTWLDSSGNGNNGTFRSSGDTRYAEYFISDVLNTPEVRFRELNASYAKLYQSGYSPDALTTTYTGSDTGTFTFGGWVKVNSNFTGFWLTRGNDALGGGWSLILSGGLNGTVGLSAVPSGSGAFTSTRAASTILQSDIWYHVYMIWKPNAYVKIYLNGALEAQWTNTYSGLRSSTAGFGINSNVLNNTNGYGRTIVGAYHVYDRELTEAEIKQNFNAQRGRYNVASADDSDAQAFVVAAGLTNTTQITAINTLVTALKTAGIWTKMKAIYPFVGGTAYSHKFNLKDPRNVDAAFRLTFSGGMTHSSTGVLFGGVNGFADTFFRPGSNYDNTTWNAHMSFYSRSNVEAPTTNWLSGGFGVDSDYSSAAYFVLIVNRKGTRTVDGRLIGTQWASYTSALDDSRGLFMINKQSEALLKLTKNTTLLAQNTTSSWSVNKPGDKLYLGAVNGSQSYSGLNYDNKEYAFATIGSGLTDAEATAFYNAVQAYQTALGRAV